MYIVDEQQVKAIYDNLKDLTANSFEGKTIIDPALDIGDKIIVNGKAIIYQGELDFQGRFIAEIKSKIEIKQKQETTVKKQSQKVINRRVQSRINEAEGKITQLIEENNETSSKLTKVEQTVDGISQSVTSVEEKIETVESKADTAQLIANSATQKAENAETNANNAQSTANIANNNAQKAQDTANNINNNLSQNYYTKTETNSQIKQEADSITQSVSKTYSTKTETTNAKNEAIKSANASTDKKLEGYITTAQMKSEIKQTADEINLEVKKKVDENEIISSINQSAEAIQIKADKINIHGKKVSFETNIESKYRYSSSDLSNIQKYIMGEISLTDSQLELYDINKDGKLTSSDYVIIRNLVDSNGDVTIKGSFEINPDSASRSLILRDAKRNIITSIGLLGMETESFYCQNFESDKGVIKALEVQENLIVNREGHVMHGRNLEHTYSCLWTGSQLQFWVDNTNVGTLSDKRLKKEIQEIDNDFIKAIEEIEMKQFKIANRNGLISFGILAQDLIEIFKKYKKNPFDYEVVQETQYRTDDDTIYYTINYEQFLILKQKATDIKIKQLQEENKNKDELIKELIKRVEKLEGKTNGN